MGFLRASVVAANAAYPLNEPLPPGVALGGESILAFYRRYPIFSWPWIWRRAVLLSPLAIVPALIAGLDYGAAYNNIDLAIGVSWRFARTNLLTLLIPPLLGLCARHINMRPGIKDPIVSLALILGSSVMLTVLLQDVNRFVLGYMRANPAAALPWVDIFFDPYRGWLSNLLSYFYMFGLSGVYAINAYGHEAERWQKHARKIELDTVRRQRDHADMALTVLQAQVEPHFLFNTLASVRSLVGSDPKRATATIDALAEHLRATLPKLRSQTGASSSTLGEQFVICESYLKVMRVRMGSRLRTTIALPQHLQDVPFPPLMLISLVENAIKHGVEPRAGDVEVKLEAAVLNEDGKRTLEVRVCDDGVGLSPGMGEGTGLANIRAQLQHRFAEGASLRIESPSAGGLAASIRIPIDLLAI